MSGIFGTSLLVQGSEVYLADRAVANRVAAATAEVPTAELHDVDAVNLDAGQFTELVGGSLFSSYTVVVVRELAELPADLAPAVIEAASHPHEELCLTLVHPGGVKGKGVIDKLKKAKVPLVEAKPLKTYELPDFIVKEARSRGVRVDREAAQSLVDGIGTDMRALVGALMQVASDADGQVVSAELVKRYFGGRAEVTGFSISDDALNGNLGGATEKLRWALETGVAPVQITSAFAMGLRGLGKYIDMRANRMSENELAKQVGVPPWKLKDLSRQSRAWTPAGVSVALQAVARADGDVKGAAADAEFALERMLLTIAKARG